MLIRLSLMIAVALALLTNAATAENRYALVIGNGDYQNAGNLENAPNDARLIAASLESMGFEVDLHIDLDENSLGQAIENLAEKRDKLDVVAFYFAGHGLQKNGQNFLVPTDANLTSEHSIERETIAINTLIDILKPVPVSLIFLDACRNNPFAEAMIANSQDRSVTVKRGLAVIRTEGDMLVVYATLPNSVASDGAGDNSPFAKALARHMRTPDTEISVLMKRVTRDVMSETDGSQRPQQLSQMQTEFYFKRTAGGQKERDTLRALLTVYPAKVTVGQEISVVADVQASCQPSFFNLSPSAKLTPIPLRFFKSVDLSNGQFRYEISPGSRYGLVIQEEDETGINRIGFLCEPTGLSAKEDVRAVLKSVVAALDSGQTSGFANGGHFGQVEYRFEEFTIH